MWIGLFLMYRSVLNLSYAFLNFDISGRRLVSQKRMEQIKPNFVFWAKEICEPSLSFIKSLHWFHISIYYLACFSCLKLTQNAEFSFEITTFFLPPGQHYYWTEGSFRSACGSQWTTGICMDSDAHHTTVG